MLAVADMMGLEPMDRRMFSRSTNYATYSIRIMSYQMIKIIKDEDGN